MDLDQIDPDTLKLIIELQRSDTESSHKGKQPEGQLSDEEFAMELYKTELESYARCLTDRDVSNDIAQEPTLGEGNASSSSERNVAQFDQQALGFLIPEDSQVDALVEAESSAQGASRSHDTQADQGECVSCSEKAPATTTVRCPCSHEYCVSCLSKLFEACLTDETLYPPRCCRQPIPLEPNIAHLEPSLVTSFRAKELEYTTPNRTYCHRENCSAFIPTEGIRRDIAVCPSCHARTCSICKGREHQFECPQDADTNQVLRIATENGWQRCRTCRRVIELNLGCNHISKIILINSL